MVFSAQAVTELKCRLALMSAARREADEILAAEVVNNLQLYRILAARLATVLGGDRELDAALAELEADAESAGGARRHVLMTVVDRLRSPLWQLEVSCAFPPPSSATRSSPRR